MYRAAQSPPQKVKKATRKKSSNLGTDKKCQPNTEMQSKGTTPPPNPRPYVQGRVSPRGTTMLHGVKKSLADEGNHPGNWACGEKDQSHSRGLRCRPSCRPVREQTRGINRKKITKDAPQKRLGKSPASKNINDHQGIAKKNHQDSLQKKHRQGIGTAQPKNRRQV